MSESRSEIDPFCCVQAYCSSLASFVFLLFSKLKRKHFFHITLVLLSCLAGFALVSNSELCGPA